MKKEFVSKNESLELKKLGFDKECIAKYQKQSEGAIYSFQWLKCPQNSNVLDNAISTPTFSQTFRWFREKYDLWSEIHVEDNVRLGEQKYYWNIFGKYISYEGNNWIRAIVDSKGVMSNTYEEAELACLLELINICKKK